MRIVAGYEIGLRCEQPTAMFCLLSVHPSHTHLIEGASQVTTAPAVPLHHFHDTYGNLCTRLIVPPGDLHMRADFAIHGQPQNGWLPYLHEVQVEGLPDEVVPFLWPSRYCESDKLAPIAWSQFGGTQRGAARVEAVLDYVANRVRCGYEHASPTRSAWESHQERRGVGRDCVHLALALCRALNIPARYATGFVAQPAESALAPADFGVWLEVYLSNGWVAVDPQPLPRAPARIVMAYGRDASDVALYTTFGPSELLAFRVYCHGEANAVSAQPSA